jgi:hypothetical protein
MFLTDDRYATNTPSCRHLPARTDNPPESSPRLLVDPNAGDAFFYLNTEGLNVWDLDEIP